MRTAMMLIIPVIWCLLVSNINPYKVDCTVTDCQNSFINCPPRENCFVSCTESESCIQSVINCPVNGNCNVKCSGTHACQDILIDATLLSGNLNVLCDGKANSTNHCKRMQIYGNTLQSHSAQFNIECNGYLNSCIAADIYCPLNGVCNISCNGYTSCQYAVITGVMQSELSIECTAQRSCFGAIFNGAHSSRLSITGCIKDKSCLNLAIHCPPHTNDVKNCFIEGNDNLGRDTATQSPTLNPIVDTLHPSISPTQTPTLKPSVSPISNDGDGILIYAMNGWKDVDIHYTGSFGVTHDGMMICGSNYDTVCNLAAHDWACADSNGYCDNDNSVPSNTTQHMVITKMPTLFMIDIIHDIDDKVTTTEQSNSSIIVVMEYNERVKGDVFILTGVCVVLLTCLCVGCAKFRKSIADAQNAQHQRQCGVSTTRSMPSSMDEPSVSRGHHSKRNIYDAVHHDVV